LVINDGEERLGTGTCFVRTLGHIRSHGCRDLLVYCPSGHCHHGAVVKADWLLDETASAR
jgi:hypothetical protein